MKKLFFLAALTLFVRGATPARPETWSRAAQADAAVKTYMEHFHVPAMSVAVLKNGQIVYEKGWGLATILPAVPAGPKTLYRLASMSKSLTAILAEDMIDKNKIGLDVKARTLLPGLPSFHTEKFEQLLSHLGGVRHYQGASDPCNWQTTQYLYIRDALKLFQMSPLVSLPGDAFNYSTPGFTVAGAMMEKKVGIPFQLYAATKFASWDFPAIHPEIGKNSKRAIIWKLEAGKNKIAERDNLSWKYAGGGFEASVHDLALFGYRLIRGKVIPKARMEDMWTVRKNAKGESTGYGLGWGIHNDSPRFVDHSGSQNGANSYWRLYPDDGTVVVMLSNRSEHDPANIGAYLSRLAMASDREVVPTYQPPATLFDH